LTVKLNAGSTKQLGAIETFRSGVAMLSRQQFTDIAEGKLGRSLSANEFR
jgi:hypothetical protein